MESTVQVPVPKIETTPVWTEEKHLHFISTMEASFVRTMLHRYGGVSAYHHHQHLRLDRLLPDTSESTLDSKPRRTPNKHAPSDSLGPRSKMESRRRRRLSSQLRNSLMEEQVVPQLGNVGEGAAFVGGDDDKRTTEKQC